MNDKKSEQLVYVSYISWLLTATSEPYAYQSKIGACIIAITVYIDFYNN